MRIKLISFLISINIIFLILLNASIPNTSGSEKDDNFNSINLIEQPLNEIAITNVVELQNMKSNLSGNYYLANNIDCTNTKVWNNFSGFDPIGNITHKFNGTLNGNGFEIINLTLNRTSIDFIGMFGCLNDSAMIKNVNFRNLTVMGNSSIGGLIGQMNNGSVLNCSIRGKISGNNSVGGLIGIHNRGLVNHCSFNGILDGIINVGGLIGSSENSTLDHCYTYGTINGTTQVGGLIGKCGNDNGNGSMNLENCYSNCRVNGITKIGGLLGMNYNGTITNCYSNGLVTGDSNTGGLIGGGYGTIINSFWDNITSKQINSFGGTGKNTTEMMKRLTYTNAGWDFINIWDIGDGSSYPFFLNWYHKPMIISKESLLTFEDTLYTVHYKANISCYPEFNNILSWALDYTPSTGWLAIDSNGTLSGIPNNSHLGVLFLNITVTDLCGGTDSQNFYLTVVNTNDPPIINTKKLENATEDVFYTFQLNGTDPDPTNDTLNWSFRSNIDDWLNINSTSGLLYGTPENRDIGIYWVNITLEDNNTAKTTCNYTLYVTNVNDPPFITTADIPVATEDIFYNVDYEAIDLDPTNDIINWTISTNAVWLTLDNVTGVLYGTPENNDVGTFWVNITANDNHGGSTWHNFDLLVNNVNDNPIMNKTNIPDSTVEDESLIIYLKARDIDPTEDTLLWNMSTNSDWLKLNSTLGILSGVPTNDDANRLFWFNLSVSDNNGGIDWINKTLYVYNQNDPPVITTNDIKVTTQGELYSVQYQASDIDPTNDSMQWQLSTNASWLNINSTSGLLSGTPKLIDLGPFWVLVTVFDNHNGSDWHNFTLTVKPQSIIENQKPTITTENKLKAEIYKYYEVDYLAIDDLTPPANLTWSMRTNASWLKFDEKNSVLSGTPIAKDIGTYWVNISVSDEHSGIGFTNFTLTVYRSNIQPINKIPILSNAKIIPSSGNTETEFSFSVNYMDEDEDPPAFIIIVIDEFEHNMTLSSGDPFDGIYKYKTKLSKGEHRYYFKANDGFDDAESNDETPITADSAWITPEITEKKDKEEDQIGNNLMVYFAILIIIIVILALIIFAFSRRKKSFEEPLTIPNLFEPDKELVEEDDERLLGELEEPLENELLESDEEYDYECPDCGSNLTEADVICPNCGAEFES